MLRELNNALRVVAAASVVAFVAVKLIDKKDTSDNDKPEDGFQTEEFDDIW